MKKFFKNSTYLSTLIGILFMLITTISFIFVHNKLYFTIMYVLNMVSTCGILIYNIVKKDEETLPFKYTYLTAFLFVGLFFIIMDNLTINFGWNMNIYDNVMYFTNIKMYSIIYAVFVLIFALYDIYIVIVERIKNTPMPIANELNLDDNLKQEDNKKEKLEVVKKTTSKKTIAKKASTNKETKKDK